MKGYVLDVEWAIRMALVIIYLITLSISAFSLSNCVLHCVDLHSILSEVTQCMVVATIPISIFHAWDHLSNFCKPKLQSQIVRIIWLVPVFCLESYFSMMFVDQAMYFQALRESYEAYVIHCFMRLILQYMGEEGNGQSVAARLENYPASMGVHKPPFCCLNPWQMGSEFVVKCKTGVFQYVVVRFFNTVLTTVLFTLGLYEEGKYSITKPYIWIMSINFVSQSWALYSLFLFFLCAHKELHGMRPFSKFLCIKLIIFFSFWQSLLIGVMVRVGRINKGYGHSAQEIAVMIRVTMISCEMLVAAIAFMYAFPISEFPSALLSKSTSKRMKDSRRSRRFSQLNYAPLEQKESTPLSVDQVTPPITDRLLLHASKILECWNGPLRPNQLRPEIALSSNPQACTPTRSTIGGQQDSYHEDQSVNRTDSGDSLAALLGENREESIVEEECPPRIHAQLVVDSAPVRPSEGFLFVRSDVLSDGALSEPTPSTVNIPSSNILDTRRAHLHRGSYPFGKLNSASTEGATLISRSSPSFARRDPTSTHSPSYSQLRSKSAEKHNLHTQGIIPGGLAAGRKSGSFTLSRSLELDFERHAALPQLAEDTGSASSSECSTDGTNYQRPLPGVDALHLSTLSYTPPLTALGTHSKTKGRTRSSSKGHGSAHPPPASSWFEALCISTLPADLQEDIGDLEAQITEIYTTALPVAQLKRMIKGNNATY